MSKNSNVNPGQYKTAGRERQGEQVLHEWEKRQSGTPPKTRSKAPTSKETGKRRASSR